MKAIEKKRFGWIALAVILALAVPWAVLADSIEADADALVLQTPHANSLSATQAGGTTVAYEFSAAIGNTGNTTNDVFRAGYGDSVTVTITRAGTWLAVDPGTPNNFSFTAYQVPQAGTIRIAVPCGMTGTSQTMTVDLAATASNGRTLNPNSANLTYVIAAGADDSSCTPTDITPPSITPDVSGTLGNNGWYVSDVTVSWTVTDPDSTVTSTSGCGSTTINSDTTGTTLTCTATSAGGTSSQSVTIKRDATPPTASASASPGPNANGWNNTDVTVVWSCTDTGSGVVAPTVSATVSDEGADQSVTGTCEDHAGNTASDTQSGINIDKTAPTASASASPGPNANGWNNTDVVVSFSGSDDRSGIASCSAPVTLSSEGAGQSASGTCTDKAGNVSAPATASGINIDKTAPTFVACPAGGPFPLNSGSQSVGPIVVDATISGLNAGVSTLSGSVDTSSVGSKTVAFTAVDNAGNGATKSCSYSVIYNWNGFFRPVDNLPMLNVTKAGSAIPVKFSLSGNQGLSIFALGYPRSAAIVCESTALVDVIEETVTAGGSSLSYDSVADQYVYVWKTDKTWSGCRQLVVLLNDGTDHRANVKFTK